MQTTTLKIMALAGFSIFLNGCAMSPSMQGSLEKVLSPKLSAYLELRPTWVDNQDPDDENYFYCYGEFPNSKNFIYAAFPHFTAVDRHLESAGPNWSAIPHYKGGWYKHHYGFNSSTEKVHFAMQKHILQCLKDKVGSRAEPILKSPNLLKGRFVDVIIERSEYWFDGDYGYAKFRMNAVYIENGIRNEKSRKYMLNEWDKRYALWDKDKSIPFPKGYNFLTETPKSYYRKMYTMAQKGQYVKQHGE